MKQKKIAAALSFFCILGCCAFPSLAADKSTYTSDDAVCAAAAVIYDYKPDSLFSVNTKLGFVSDITLHPSEKVIYIGAGDTKRWLIDKSVVSGITHVYIKPLTDGIATNMVINTDQHTYRLMVYAQDGDYTPVVRWNFPEETARKLYPKGPVYKNKEEKAFLDIYAQKKGDTFIAKKMNSSYTTKDRGHVTEDIRPLKIMDDGIRTYIQVPKSNQYNYPVLYNVEETGKLSLVNYRTRGNYIVADRVFKHARLAYSSKIAIDIYPKKVVDKA